MDQSTDVGGVNLRGNRIMEMDMDVSAGKISLIEGRMIEKMTGMFVSSRKNWQN